MIAETEGWVIGYYLIETLLKNTFYSFFCFVGGFTFYLPAESPLPTTLKEPLTHNRHIDFLI